MPLSNRLILIALAGMACGGEDPDEPPPDAGALDVAADPSGCPGSYSGSWEGGATTVPGGQPPVYDESGAISGALSESMILNLTLQADGASSGDCANLGPPCSISAVVQADMQVTALLVGGTFDDATCSAQGTWASKGAPPQIPPRAGTWIVASQR